MLNSLKRGMYIDIFTYSFIYTLNCELIILIRLIILGNIVLVHVQLP